MPVPSKERVTELISDLVQRQGYDLEGVAVTLAGRHSAVRIMVDSDAGLELDAVANLSHEISEVFDSVSDFGESPYTLEVTSPGIDRPLTHERHWRRARGRKARIDLANETVVGRIGVLDGDSVAVVIGSRTARRFGASRSRTFRKLLCRWNSRNPTRESWNSRAGFPRVVWHPRTQTRRKMKK